MSLGPFRRSAGIVDRSDRGKLHFTGEQAHWFLDQLVTNDVESLETGQGVEALLLTPKGRITAVMRLLSSGKSVFADLDPGQASDLREFFGGRIFATKVEIADRTNDFGMLTVLGPKADEIVANALARFVPGESQQDQALGSNLPGDEEHHVVHFGSVALVRVLRPIRGVELWVRAESTSQLADLLEEMGAEPVTSEDFGTLCTVEGLARFGIDYDEGHLPQEAAMESAVHFDKGCYLGQEAVAMAQRGRVKRRVRHLEFDGDGRIGRVVLDGDDAGVVTSAGTENGKGFGIGTVKTSVEPGSTVEIVPETGTSAKATLLELPGSSRGPEVPSARELRERLQKR